MNYSPKFFSSLLKSCYDSDFYSRIKDISLGRATYFLFLLSLLVAIISAPFFYSFFSNQEDRTAGIVEYYETHVPSFDAKFEDGILETIPPRFGIYYEVDAGRTLLTKNTRGADTLYVLEVDSSRSIDDAPADLIDGAYVFRDGVYLKNNYMTHPITFDELEIPLNISFSKEMGLPILKSFTLIALEWAKKASFSLLPFIVLLYMFISNWIKAIFFAMVGILMLYAMGKKINFAFLIRLSFYATVPSLMISVLTALMSIHVSFLPLLIYAIYYYYGLRQYK